MKSLLLSFLLLASPYFGFAQDHSQDKIAIEKQVDAVINSWNNHNYNDMKDYATEDADWVNVVGMWWKNRKEVQYAHQVFHIVMFQNTPLSKTSVHTRFITNDVAVVHLYWHIGAYTTPNGNHYNEAENLALMVFVNKTGKWLLTSTENLVINESAQQSNPVSKMPKE